MRTPALSWPFTRTYARAYQTTHSIIFSDFHPYSATTCHAWGHGLLDLNNRISGKENIIYIYAITLEQRTPEKLQKMQSRDPGNPQKHPEIVMGRNHPWGRGCMGGPWGALGKPCMGKGLGMGLQGVAGPLHTGPIDPFKGIHVDPHLYGSAGSSLAPSLRDEILRGSASKAAGLSGAGLFAPTLGWKAES